MGVVAPLHDCHAEGESCMRHPPDIAERTELRQAFLEPRDGVRLVGLAVGQEAGRHQSPGPGGGRCRLARRQRPLEPAPAFAPATREVPVVRQGTGKPEDRLDGARTFPCSAPSRPYNTSLETGAGSYPPRIGSARSAKDRTQAAWAPRTVASSPLSASRSSPNSRTVSSIW